MGSKEKQVGCTSFIEVDNNSRRTLQEMTSDKIQGTSCKLVTERVKNLCWELGDNMIGGNMVRARQNVAIDSRSVVCAHTQSFGLYVHRCMHVHKFITFRGSLEAAIERTNVPGSSECKWTSFHHPRKNMPFCKDQNHFSGWICV